MYSKSYSSVKLGDKLYGHFQTCSGVRQGDNLSPNLRNLRSLAKFLFNLP